MQRLNVFFSFLSFWALVAFSAPQAKAQINLTGSGPSPSSLQVKTGSSIGFTGVRKGEFYGGTVTSAPAGSAVAVGGNPQWLAGCLDFGFTTDVSGTYTFEVTYDAGTYTGSITAATGDTAFVTYTDSGPTPTSLDVNVGDVIIFQVGDIENCAEQVYLAMTSVPHGASNPVPPGSGYDIGTTGHGPLIYPVTVPGTYSYTLGAAYYSGSITATAAASASVGEGVQPSGFSMTVTPEPSNGAATIVFSGDKPVDLHLALFDASGRQVHQYEDIEYGAGEYSMPLSSNGLPSGNYYLRASAGGAIVATANVLVVH